MLYQCHRIAAWFWKIAKWMIPLNNLPPYLLSHGIVIDTSWLTKKHCHIKAINKIFHRTQMYSYLTKYIATSAKKSVSKAKWIFPKSLSALLENFYSHLSVSQGRTDFITKNHIIFSCTLTLPFSFLLPYVCVRKNISNCIL